MILAIAFGAIVIGGAKRLSDVTKPSTKYIYDTYIKGSNLQTGGATLDESDRRLYYGFQSQIQQERILRRLDGAEVTHQLGGCFRHVSHFAERFGP